MNFAILISGTGSNMTTIVKHCKKRLQQWQNIANQNSTNINNAHKPKPWKLFPKLVISNNAQAAGLQTAKELGLKAIHIGSGKFRTRLDDNAMQIYIKVLQEHNIHLILLAGFMCVIHKPLLNAFNGRIINIHPSLLPLYPGLNTTKHALQNKQPHIGATLHLVNAEVDGGKILLQQSMAVMPAAHANKKQIAQNEQIAQENFLSTIQTELQKLEHSLYIELLERLNDGRITIL